MNNSEYVVRVKKEIETQENGKTLKQTLWEDAGRVWPSKTGTSLILKLNGTEDTYVLLPKQKPKFQDTPF